MELQRKKQSLTLKFDGETIRNLHVFTGHDWENQTQTILFTGLDDKVVTTPWGIDLHYPHPENSMRFPGMEFIAYAERYL